MYEGNSLGQIIAEQMATAPTIKPPPHFALFALPAIPGYALVIWLCLHYGSDGLSAFTLANSAIAIYFVCVSAFYQWYTRRINRQMREWRKANGWL